MALCNIAYTLVKNTRYVTFDTCLDYLPAHSTANDEWGFLPLYLLGTARIYLVDGFLILILSETLQTILNKFLVEVMLFSLRSYHRTYRNFIFTCEILFPEWCPFIRLIFLGFFEMVLILSSDIEIQPGPYPNALKSPTGGFKNSFFFFLQLESQYPQ